MRPERAQAPDSPGSKSHRGSSPAPYDPTVELAALGVALDTAWAGPIPDLTADDFWVPDHRDLWNAATGLIKPIRPKDLPERLRPLARQAVKAWVPADATTAPAVLRRLAAARRAISTCHDIAEAARHADVHQAAALAHQLAEDLDAA